MKKEELIVTALNHSDEGIIVADREFNTVYANKAAEKYLNAVISAGTCVSEILPGIFGEKAIPRKTEIRKGNKSLLISCTPLDGECFIRISDISRIKHLEHVIKCDRQIFDLVDAGILISDENGIVQVFNTFLEKEEGRSRKDVEGKYILDAYNNTAETSEQLTVLKTKEPLVNVDLNYKINGKELSTISTTYPLFCDEELVRVVSVSRNLEEARQLLDDVIKISSNRIKSTRENGAYFHFKHIVGNSPAITAAIDRATKAAANRAPVFLFGETGTGKEMFAQSIHNESAECQEPFVAINCAAIPETLLESLLFGTVKGSYTDAKDNIGLFEQAGNGTLYLDEINSMPPALQAKILRVLQEKSVRRLGDTKERPVKCRIISSSNLNPLDCLKKGLLRKDLYYRLIVIPIEIPPLRERREDIGALMSYFLEYYGKTYNKTGLSISSEYYWMISNHEWSGNVRELEHTIESSVAMLEDEKVLEPRHLPCHLFHDEDRESGGFEGETFILRKVVEKTERELISAVLERNYGNVTVSARELGISRQNLQYYIKKYALSDKLKS